MELTQVWIIDYPHHEFLPETHRKMAEFSDEETAREYARGMAHRYPGRKFYMRRYCEPVYRFFIKTPLSLIFHSAVYNYEDAVRVNINLAAQLGSLSECFGGECRIYIGTVARSAVNEPPGAILEKNKSIGL